MGTMDLEWVGHSWSSRRAALQDYGPQWFSSRVFPTELGSCDEGRGIGRPNIWPSVSNLAMRPFTLILAVLVVTLSLLTSTIAIDRDLGPLPPVGLGISRSMAGSPTTVFEDLEPADDSFSFTFPESYHRALVLALLGDDPYRICQLVAIPAFRPEWAVYAVKPRSTGAVRLIATRFRTPLWSDGQRLSKDGSIDFEFDHFTKQDLRSKVDVWETSLAPDTVDALRNVWTQMLARVRYSQSGVIGLDGVQYHVSNWAEGIGFRSGRTWSPDPGTRTAALVELAEHMLKTAQTPSVAAERDLQGRARALLARIGANRCTAVRRWGK